MKMNLKNYEIVSAMEPIQKLMKEKLPTKVSWILTKNLRKLSEPMSDINDAEQKMVQQYGVKDAKGAVIGEDGRFKLKEDCIEEFTKKRVELFNCENELDIHMIKLSDLSRAEIEGDILLAIEFMIEDDLEDDLED